MLVIHVDSCKYYYYQSINVCCLIGLIVSGIALVRAISDHLRLVQVIIDPSLQKGSCLVRGAPFGIVAPFWIVVLFWIVAPFWIAF